MGSYVEFPLSTLLCWGLDIFWNNTIEKETRRSASMARCKILKYFQIVQFNRRDWNFLRDWERGL